jgi:hypothetical protein
MPLKARTVCLKQWTINQIADQLLLSHPQQHIELMHQLEGALEDVAWKLLWKEPDDDAPGLKPRPEVELSYFEQMRLLADKRSEDALTPFCALIKNDIDSHGENTPCIYLPEVELLIVKRSGTYRSSPHRYHYTGLAGAFSARMRIYDAIPASVFEQED